MKAVWNNATLAESDSIVVVEGFHYFPSDSINRPLNDLFVVYNERRATTGEVRERALIVKLTYLFDF